MIRYINYAKVNKDKSLLSCESLRQLFYTEAFFLKGDCKAFNGLAQSG